MKLVNRIRSYFRLKKAEKQVEEAYKGGEINPSFGPSSLNLMMTDSCNAQCIMCGKDYKSCGTKAHLSLGDIETIYQHLDMSQVVDVIYGGGGEPFLNPDLGKIAAYTRSHYPVIQHTVISNMIQWKEEVVMTLLDSGVHFLTSINAASETIYKRVSGVDGFTRVIDHVERLRQLRDEKRGNNNIAISIILMRQNIGELVDFIKLADRLGVDEVKSLYVRVYPEHYRIKDNQSETIKADDSLYFMQEEADKTIEAAETVAREKGLTFDHEPLFKCGQTCERNCTEPWKSLFINFNGDVYPCPASEILFKPKVDSGMYRSGNILKQHIDEIWNNDFWQALRKTNVAHGREEILPECQCCGNAINWSGPQSIHAHILDWRKSEESDLRI